MSKKSVLALALNRKKGLTWVEITLGFIILILVSIVLTSVFQEGMFRLKKWRLTNQVTEISSGADTWKGLKSNFTGLSMTAVCAVGQQSVGATTCGGAGGTGANTNAFGGSFELAPASNVSLKSLKITNLPAARVNEIADGLAGMTADQCTSVTGCSTVTVAGTTLTLTL
ncbi:hypothetical protein [Vibrio sp. 1180_3]|uniref:hypothetical protein n=1 Tax=Vibrio sp. 1180_3 TaxID=2528832 RepID=UPI002404B32B|nr:hypothetical protein [Vibrio sp. 1180_3]MDF9399137.1 hypothetical protein [Vibrio sp. 1180_3]